MTINKVYVRQLISELLTNYLLWQRARSGAAGFASINFKHAFENTAAEMAGYLEGFDNAVSPSPIWRQAFKIAAQWRMNRRVSHIAMDRLMVIFQEYV